MAVHRGGNAVVDMGSADTLSRRVRPVMGVDERRAMQAQVAPPNRFTQSYGGDTRQMMEPSVAQDVLLAVRDLGAGRDTPNSRWLEGNIMGTFPTEQDDDTSGGMSTFRRFLDGVRGSALSGVSASGDRLRAALSGIDPQTAFEFNVAPAAIGAGAADEYLRAIGASTGDSEAVRNLEQQLLGQMVGGAEQFTKASRRAFENERLARLAAAEMLQADAEQAIEQQVLAARLRGAV